MQGEKCGLYGGFKFLVLFSTLCLTSSLFFSGPTSSPSRCRFPKRFAGAVRVACVVRPRLKATDLKQTGYLVGPSSDRNTWKGTHRAPFRERESPGVEGVTILPLYPISEGNVETRSSKSYTDSLAPSCRHAVRWSRDQSDLPCVRGLRFVCGLEPQSKDDSLNR